MGASGLTQIDRRECPMRSMPSSHPGWARRAALGAAALAVVAGTKLAPAQSAPVALRGQTPEQMAIDQRQCASQATAQTGFNPATPPATPATKPVGGQHVAGAMRGGATGKIVSTTTKGVETDKA